MLGAKPGTRALPVGNSLGAEDCSCGRQMLRPVPLLPFLPTVTLLAGAAQAQWPSLGPAMLCWTSEACGTLFGGCLCCNPVSAVVAGISLAGGHPADGGPLGAAAA